MRLKSLWRTVLCLLVFMGISTAQFSVKLPYTDVTVENVNGKAVFKGATVVASPGKPLLPLYKVRFILPPDVDSKDVSVSIVDPAEKELDGHFEVDAALPPSRRGEINWPKGLNIIDGKDADVYLKHAYFPADYKGKVYFGKMRRYQVMDVYVSPYRFNPVTGKLKVITAGTLTVDFPGKRSTDVTIKKQSTDWKPRNHAEKYLKKQAANPEVLEYYHAKASSQLESARTGPLTEGYAIITTSAIANASTQLSNLITQKTDAGYNVLLLTESIWGGGTGDVAADNIRAWLKANWESSNIRYALLIGDPTPSTGDVPMKMCWPRNQSDPDNGPPEAPSDFYYAELSGTWNKDLDEFFGEEEHDYGSWDIDAEIAVGRIPHYPSSTIADLDKILLKSINYADETSRGWRKTVLLPMEPLDALTPAYHLAEAMNNDYLQPNEWATFRIYDKENNYRAIDDRRIEEVFALDPPVERAPCNEQNVLDVWQKNPFGLVLWSTHGLATSAAGVFDSHMADELNDAYPSIVFQMSCNNAYAESEENLAYSILRNGGVVTIGATRESWYEPGQTSFDHAADHSGMGYNFGQYLTTGLPVGDALNEVKRTVVGLYWSLHCMINVYGLPDLSLNIDHIAPSNLAAAATGLNSINLYWKDNSYIETGFKIERATGSGPFSEIATVGMDVTNYQDVGLTPDTKYKYRVCMYSGTGGNSEYTNIDSTTTYKNHALEKTVTASSHEWWLGNYRRNAVDGNTSTRWAASSGSMPQWYTVDLGAELAINGCEIMFERPGTNGDCNDFVVETSSDNATWTTRVNRNPNTNTAQTQTYFFPFAAARYVRITISDAPGSYFASMFEFRVLGPATPSPVFTFDQSSVPTDQVSLSWTPSPGATSYIVKQSSSPGAHRWNTSIVTDPECTTYGLIGNDKMYIYTIIAYNDAGHSLDMPMAFEQQVFAYTTLPQAPMMFTISPNNPGYSFRWADCSSNEQGFLLERRTYGTSIWTEVNNVGYNVRDAVDLTAADLTNYEYRVVAFNDAGRSENNPTVNSSIWLNANANSRTQVTLTWVDRFTNVTGFFIERAGSNNVFSVIASVGANEFSYIDTDLSPYTSYSYRVRAYNSSENSDYSDIVTVKTHGNLSVLYGTASASSEQTGNFIGNAKDNWSHTRWAASSGSMPQWYMIDLGSERSISEFEIMFERTGTTGDCNDFIIQTSPDNATWTTQVSMNPNSNTAQTQAYSVSITARYARITIYDAPGSYYASMYEFKVIGQTEQ